MRLTFTIEFTRTDEPPPREVDMGSLVERGERPEVDRPLGFQRNPEEYE